ncbi:MAG: hypothetical protein WBR18_04575 [Anaerolineales bacterium]
MRQFILCLLMFVLSACAIRGSNSAAYQVSGTALGAPAECGPNEVAEQLADLGSAISHAELNRTMEFFRGGPFHWYSMSEASTSETNKRHFVAYTLDDLEAYFIGRFTHDEHWALKELQVNSWDAERGLVHFGPVHIRRTADDLPEGLGGAAHLAEGKGAYHCVSKTFAVLSLGMDVDQQ